MSGILLSGKNKHILVQSTFKQIKNDVVDWENKRREKQVDLVLRGGANANIVLFEKAFFAFETLELNEESIL